MEQVIKQIWIRIKYQPYQPLRGGEIYLQELMKVKASIGLAQLTAQVRKRIDIYEGTKYVWDYSRDSGNKESKKERSFILIAIKSRNRVLTERNIESVMHSFQVFPHRAILLAREQRLSSENQDNLCVNEKQSVEQGFSRKFQQKLIENWDNGDKGDNGDNGGGNIPKISNSSEERTIYLPKEDRLYKWLENDRSIQGYQVSLNVTARERWVEEVLIILDPFKN